MKNIKLKEPSILLSNALYELNQLARSIISESYTPRLISSGEVVEANYIRDIYAVLRHYADKEIGSKK